MTGVWLWLGRERKALVAEASGIVAWAQIAYVPDGTISREEWIGLAVVVLGGLGVHAVTNAPPSKPPGE